MEIKLKANNIQSVQYRLSGQKTANMHFDIDGFLTDVDIEETFPYNPENDKAKKPLINEVQKMESDEINESPKNFERSKKLMDSLFGSDGSFNCPKKNESKNEDNELPKFSDEKLGEIKTSFDRFVNQWNEAGLEYWSKADEAKRDAKRDALITDFILDNKNVFSRGCIRALIEEILNENITETEFKPDDEESITADIIKKTADGEWKNKMKDVLDKCDTIEKEVLNEMAARYRPEVFNSENAIEQPKLDEYREKNGFPNVEDEKKVIIENKKDIFGNPIGSKEGVEINGKQIVIKEYNTNVDNYGKNL